MRRDTTADHAARTASEDIVLPDGPRSPFLLRLLAASFDRSKTMSLADRRRQYGSDFTLRLPIYGKSLVISEPDEVREARQLDDDVGDDMPLPEEVLKTKKGPRNRPSWEKAQT